jgi:hypothetical protein
MRLCNVDHALCSIEDVLRRPLCVLANLGPGTDIRRGRSESSFSKVGWQGEGSRHSFERFERLFSQGRSPLVPICRSYIQVTISVCTCDNNVLQAKVPEPAHHCDPSAIRIPASDLPHTCLSSLAYPLLHYQPTSSSLGFGISLP